jgi:tetratricopeptide (TPR) repeat protein
MTATRHKNAIERRLDLVQAHWDEFAVQKGPRLLVWQADGEDARLVEVFFEIQREGAGDSPDLFVRLQAPFERSGYGRALTGELRRLYDEARPALAAAGLAADWVCPELPAGVNDAVAFGLTCASFRDYYQALGFENLALALTPADIADPLAWRDWLGRLVRAGLPGQVRVTVLDSVAAPALERLIRAEPGLVAAVRPELDLPDAYLELVREVKGTGPGHAFRRLFVGLTNAAERGDVLQAEKVGRVALAVAEREGWAALAGAVHLALGAVRLAAGGCEPALTSFRAAAAAAAQAVAAQDPGGPKLALNARFAEGAALLSAGRFAEAAQVYETAAPAAAAIPDHLLTLEAWRMAGYCHEQAGAASAAWRCGEQALDAGGLLDDTLRPHSTLPQAADGLLRLAEQPPYCERAGAVRRRLAELIGTDAPRGVAP